MKTWNDLKNFDLRVYGADWCPDCLRFKRILQRNGLSFTDIDIDQDLEARDSMVQRAGEFSIPQLEIDGRWMVRGWHSEALGNWNEKTFFTELARTVDPTPDRV
ncbi:MAG: glutaredoxin family protein [Spirochaetales bacterium]|nr:glutaredoxin family protein [Spirochaetales bacterium]